MSSELPSLTHTHDKVSHAPSSQFNGRPGATKEYSDDQIWAALEQASLSDFVKAQAKEGEGRACGAGQPPWGAGAGSKVETVVLQNGCSPMSTSMPTPMSVCGRDINVGV